MYNRIIDFINKHNILYKYHFGFRKQHSTTMALTTVVTRILEALEKGDKAIGVFLDFSKAFGTLNHDILCKN